MKFFQSQSKKTKNGALLLIFLTWLVYATSYLGKVNYSANITQIIDFYGVTKAQAGAVPTFFFFAYGIGQVFNGLFCKKYNIKWVVLGSLLISATINLIIATTSYFAVIKWLWMLNGFVLSMLWPTLLRVLSETLPKKDLKTAIMFMGTTVASGTLMIYALSSLYAAFNKFKLAFYTAGVAVVVVAIVWLFIYDKAVKSAKFEAKAEDAAQENQQAQTKKGSKKIFYASIPALCFCAIGVNLIKDGLTTWVPSILKEEFHMTDSLSILLTLFLPVLAIFGNMFALKVYSKIPDYISHCAATFAVIAVLVGVIIGSLRFEWVVFMVLCLVIVNFLASSLNNLVTGIFPLFAREMISSGFIAGVLNGFCYLGSTISSYGLGSIADHFGWTAVFITLLGFCAAAFVVWGIYSIYKRCCK